MSPFDVKAILKSDPRSFFLFSARWAFGWWLVYVGVSKWLGGAAGFVGYISSTFAETWLPAPLVLITAWAIIVLEPLCGLWLVVGKRQRLAWIATSKLMFMLMLGQTILKEYGTVANNWQYVLFAIICASLCDPDE